MCSAQLNTSPCLLLWLSILSQRLVVEIVLKPCNYIYFLLRCKLTGLFMCILALSICCVLSGGIVSLKRTALFDRPKLYEYLQTNVKDLGMLPSSSQLRNEYLPKVFEVYQLVKTPVASASSIAIVTDEASASMSEWVSSCSTAHQHNTGYSVPLTVECWNDLY